MKRLAIILGVLLGFSVPVEAALHARYNFINSQQFPQGVKKVRLTPLLAYTVLGTNVVTGDWMEKTVNANGSVTFSNLIPGSYRVLFTGSFTPTTFTNSFGTNVTGLVDASDSTYLSISTNLANDLFAYSQTVSDSRFSKQGVIVRVETNGTETAYATLELANAAARPGETLRASGFNVISNAVTLTNLTLIGPATFISWVGFGQGPAICPYAGSVLDSFSIYSGWVYLGYYTNVVQLIGTDHTVGQPAITNAIIRNLKMFGDNDGIFVKHTNFCKFRVENVFGFAATDLVAQQGGAQEADFYNIEFDVCTNGSSAGWSVDCAATNRLFNPKIIMNASAGQSSGIAAAYRYGSGAANAWTEIHGGEFIGKALTPTNFLISMPFASGKVVAHGTKFRNVGASTDLVAIRTANASATADLYNVEVFSEGGSTNQFLISNSKGQINFSGGNIDPTRTFGNGLTKILPIANGFFLKATATAPSDTATPDAWVTNIVNGTEYRMPLYTP